VTARDGLPKAVLLDLDDTILDDSSRVDDCWNEACRAHAGEAGVDARALRASIERTSKWFWGDPERHRIGRLDLDATRCRVVRMSLAAMGIADDALANLVGGTYSRLRDEMMAPIDGSIETVEWLRDRGCRLALLTNGSGPAQRRKIERFSLAPLFDAIFIEGELGFGKPDPRVYTRALDTLGVSASDAWMAGDSLPCDVEQPQRMGMFAIWVNRREGRDGELSDARPDRIVRRLSELRT
jgi:putative hydrolase of the HAD superfamily